MIFILYLALTDIHVPWHTLSKDDGYDFEGVSNRLFHTEDEVKGKGSETRQKYL